MGNKIKITESQLKRIMEQQSMDEVSVGSTETELAKKYAKMITDDLKQNNMNSVNMEWLGRGIEHELKYYKPEDDIDTNMEMDSQPDMEIADDDFPEPPSDEETQANQIYEGIKNNFKRFL
jgi:hypothetical protein